MVPESVQELLARNEYLAAENRILKAQLNGRLALSDADRATLGEIGHRLGRKVLAEAAAVAQPDIVVTPISRATGPLRALTPEGPAQGYFARWRPAGPVGQARVSAWYLSGQALRHEPIVSDRTCSSYRAASGGFQRSPASFARWAVTANAG